ncbi:MAG: phosphatase PAP2 family protein [Crocinitomicaceae bacterium]|jgi:membrane-associated phospholipid phosphatase|nr:phosphatase PAP2 family protein [Crocinitomicaceae bacterium]
MKNSITQTRSQTRIKALFKWGLIGAFTCSGIYLGTNEIAAQRTSFYQLYFEFEREIPMVPWMIHIYNSFHILLFMNFLIIKDPLKIKAIAISLISSSAIASVFFLLLPAELGFSRTENIQGYEFWYNALHWLDHPHNLVPSLHITFSALSAYVISTEMGSVFLRLIFLLWFLLICSSIVLVHQHHLIDIVSGFVLAVLVKFAIYDKLIITENS